MDINRIQREFVEAQKTFSLLELRPTTEGTVYARAALQTGAATYVLSIRFPEVYPNEMPRVYIDAPVITTSPHRYNGGNICYLHPTMWNPGIHNLTFVVGRAAKWLSKYEDWRMRGAWPGAEIRHGGLMKIDFKTLSMMDLRSTPGEVLDRVARDGDVFVVERNGQPKACLVPVSFLLPDVSPERITQELTKLHEKSEDYKFTINDKKELEVSCLETAAGDSVVLTVVMPHGYPNAAPRVYVEKVIEDTPGRWHDGSLAIFGATATWNSKTHDLTHALNLGRAWLRQYAKWRKGGEWPAGPTAT